MESPKQNQIFKIEDEKRLVATLITGAPQANSFFAASFTVVLMMVISLFYWIGPESWVNFLPAIPKNIFQDQQWWRIFTAIFIHADLEHLLSNMLMLWIFSYFIYGYFGFSVFPVITLISAAVVNALTLITYRPDAILLGASGLVYVLGGFWLAMYFFIQRQFPLLNRFIRVLGIALVLFAPSTFVPTTSYRAHGIGFFLGIVSAIIYFYSNRKKIRESEIYRNAEPESRIEITPVI